MERHQIKKKRKKDQVDSQPMDYRQNHIHKFLLEHPAIGITQLEMICKVPTGTIRHFLKNRRVIPGKYVDTLEQNLADYGFKPMGDE